MAASELFTLRPAVEGDLPLINLYTFGEGMAEVPGIEGITVAANPDGLCVGFIRMEDGVDEFDGVGFINPIVVFEPWRGYGVGKALVDDILTRYEDVRLVSRSSSLGFYRTLGFQDCTWDDIRADLVSDCDGCEMNGNECHPQPLRWTKKNH